MPGSTPLDPGVHLSIVTSRWFYWYSTTFCTANKTVKILRNNNLFNEQTHILYLSFEHSFAGNVGWTEIESHHASWKVVVFMFYTCSCWHLKHWYDGGDWPNINRISSFNQPTNQQSFYKHGSDSYLGNLNLTLFHIVIWGLNPTPKIRYFINVEIKMDV